MSDIEFEDFGDSGWPGDSDKTPLVEKDNYKTEYMPDNSYQQKKPNYQQGNNYQSQNNNFRNREQPKVNPEDVKIYLPYVGSGNDDAPEEVLRKFRSISKYLETKGYVLRVGINSNTDNAFSYEIKNKEVYIPWKNFADSDSKMYFNSQESIILALRYQPSLDRAKDSAKAFCARNVRMVVGGNIKSHAKFMLTWTADGCESKRERTSGTGNAGLMIAIASDAGIPVFNFKRPDAESRFKSFLT